ncbi:CHAT domain-containing protein [Seohaeicola nanhaiensis]|uniref:CHAT domain-containing protein n=1 Tax=Seohaeicola nanhaiensis TaxID=1387282 RepID=A0ABV9KIF1_9RHOB
MRRVLALVLALSCAGTADAETLAEVNSRAQAAFSAGDAEGARKIAAEAVELARAPDGASDLAAWSTALSNAAFLTSTTGGDMAAAEALWREVIAAQDAAGSTTVEALLARMQLANHLSRQGRTEEAVELFRSALPMARGTQWHGQAAKMVADALYAAGDYTGFALAFEEVIAVAPELIRPVYGQYYGRLGQQVTALEEQEKWTEVAPLLEAQLTILRTFYDLDDRDTAIRNLMFNRYFALSQIGDYARARTQLLAWKSFGTLTEPERAFVEERMALALPLAEGGNIDTLDRLETVREALFFASAFDSGADPRIGLALRTLAGAEAYFGQTAAAIRSLEVGASILEQTEAGRRQVFLLYEDLAWALALNSEYARADLVYAKADAAREVALAQEPDPETPEERALRLVNRARFYEWTGREELARAEIDKAQTALGTASDFRAQLVRTQIADMALASGATADTGPLQTAIAALREVAPPDNADYSMALSNAADTLMVAGERKAARRLLSEAVEINRTALPDVVPQALHTRGFLARVEMIEGDRAGATAELRRVVAARKSPVYRDDLAAAAPDFEQFAWLLIDRPDRTAAGVAEAFEALQWTQVTRSAEATALLEARLAVDDPARGALLRQRQDLAEAHAGLAARLSRAQAAGQDTGALAEEIAAVAAEMAGVDSRLDALGLDALGLGSIEPLPLAEVQALLAPDEMLVTFLLPGLTPGRIAGLEGPANHVIGVTRDGVHIARMGEASRGALNRRIQAFRCDVAVSDPGCRGGGAAGLRGAMAASGPKPRAEDHFNVAAAHALFADLFGDLADEMADYPHLIIAPPPDLLRLPFEALPVSAEWSGGLADVHWLIRDHAISVLPAIYSLRALRAQDRLPRRMEHMVGFGDPVIGHAPPARCGDIAVAALRAAPSGGAVLHAAAARAVPLADVTWLAALPRLPDSVCELEAIRDAFGGAGDLVLGDAATETRVKAMDAEGFLRGADVLVFATHGLTAGETGATAPGLVLTPPAVATLEDDGLLTAGEIAGLDLDAQLVVLSACNTAAGGDTGQDGLSGLARAFFQAGARNLLVTHWAVYSEAAVDVTTGLFTALDRDPGLRFSEALRRSVLDILDDPGRPALHHHPSYWAAFALVGAE